MSDEERAVLHELDQTFLKDDEEEGEGGASRCRAFLHSCEMVATDKGVVSLVVTFFIIVVGVALLVVVDAFHLPSWVEELSRYIISAGVFGLASGGTNWIAIIMLFYRIPLLIGSG